MPVPVKSLRDFFEVLETLSKSNSHLLYRGHSDSSFKLLPTLLRKTRYEEAEHDLLHELVASHPEDFSPDKTTLEHLVRAQHYSLPTRLLDATWNPLIALYFAVDAIQKNVDGEVVVLEIDRNKIKFYDSDAVSCIANLAYLTSHEKTNIDFNAADFNGQDSIKRLLHYIRAEKPQFEDLINPADLQTVLCVKPKQSNRRIVVQDGAFLLFGLTGELIDKRVDGISISNIPIDKDAKEEISRQLAQVGINESRMFPEIERAAKFIAQ